MKFDFNQWWAKRSFQGDVKLRQQIYRQIVKMQINNVPLIDAVRELNTLAQTKGKNHPQAVMLTIWLKELNNGHPLGLAMRGWVPDDEILLIASGEESGSLPKAMTSAIENLKGKTQIKNALVGALAYPAVLIVAAISLAWFFSSSVIPSFEGILPSDKWQGLAKTTLFVSNGVREWLVPAVITMIALAIGVVMTFTRWAGEKIPGRVFADKMIPWSIYRMMSGVSFMSSLSAMISAGTPLQDAMARIETQMRGNKYLRSRVAAILRHVRNGKDAGESMKLAKHEFPDKDIISDLRIYGKYAGFDEALSSIAAEWREEGVESIKRKAGILFVAALLTMGSVVGFFSAGLFAISNQVTASAQNK